MFFWGFANNVYSKPTFGSNKGRLAAKKIDNVDLDALTLNEDSNDMPKNKFEMSESSFGMTNQNTVKEVVSKGNSPYLPENNEDKLKKFQNAKAISSDSFKTETK